MAEAADTLSRPWAWWTFTQGIDPREAMAVRGDIERERLDELGLLTDRALADAARDEQLVHGIRNQAHEPAFRRTWHWWRFLAPERRDKTLTEAVQLVALHKEGHDVLTDRERYVVTNRADLPAYRTGCAVRVRLSRVECDALDLPDEFYSELEDE